MYSAVYIPSASPEIPLAPCGATVAVSYTHLDVYKRQGVTSVVTVTLGMNSDLQGSQKDIEKTLDTELLRSYAYWMGDAVTGISKEQDEADALKKFDDGNIVYSLVKNKPNGKERCV